MTRPLCMANDLLVRCDQGNNGHPEAAHELCGAAV